MEYGIEHLRKKSKHHASRAQTRLDAYEQKTRYSNKSITMSPQVRELYRATLGWNTKAVDSLADRLIFREFREDNFQINEIFEMNNPDIFFDAAITSALITSVSFVYISRNKENDIPRLEIIDARNATGVIDTATGLLTEGYAVLRRDDKGNPELEAYFRPGETYYYLDGELLNIERNKSNQVLLVPIIHRPDDTRPFGRSRITKTAEYWSEYAQRMLERSDVTAEFYSFPQKYATGVNIDERELNVWKATISTMLMFEADEYGNKPTLGQFQAASMAPYTEMLKTAASGFAGETGLTLDDLGFITENPSSAEAIKASHETLRLQAKKAQRSFGSGFLNVGYVSTCLRDDFAYKRDNFYLTKPIWEPAFEADASTLSLIGDGAIKINQAIPGYFTAETLRDLTGVEGGEVIE